jgi:tRNA(fMet)-specific endonuclease VapC
MKYLLDANAWIGHLRQTAPEVTRKLSTHPRHDIVQCSVVVLELLYGVEHSPPAHRAANLALVAQVRQQYVSLPFEDSAAEDAANIRAHLAALGNPIEPYDLLIAAIARANQLTVVTHNTSEFSRVPNLLVEDWQVP